MAIEIGQGVLNLTASFQGLQRDLERQVRGVDTRRAGADAGEGYNSGFGSAARKLTGILAGAFAAVKIGDFAKDAINQASDLTEVGTKLQAVFGDATGDIEEFGKTGAKSLGQSNLAAKNAAAGFGVFGKAAGLANKDNAAFSTNLAQLATDMASFSNTSVEQATEALSAGLRGETEPLRAYGVLLDDASLRQEALAQGLITTTKEALTPQQKVLAANALIFKQTADAQGDFARTSGGLANQQRILSAQWEDAKGKLGAAFLPGVTAVVSSLNEKLFPALETAGTMAKDAWGILSTGDFKGGTSLGEEDSPLVNALFTARDVFADVKGGLTEAWSILTRGDFQGGNGFEEDSPFINFLFTLRDVGLTTFDQLRGIWDTLWSVGEKLWPSLKSIGESLLGAFQTLSGSGLTVWGLLLKAFQGIADLLQTWLVPAFEWLARFMKENPASVLTFVGVILGVVGALKAWAVIQGVLNALLAANPLGLIVIALAAFAAAVVWAYNNVEWFRDLVDGAWEVISTATMWAWENVIQPVFRWISENIHVVGDTFSWLWQTISDVWTWIQEKVRVVWEWLRDNVFTPLSTALTNTGRFFTDLWNTVQNVWTWIQDKISTAWNWINQNVFAPMNLAINTIGTFFGNLWTTVETIWTKITGFFSNVAQGISDAVGTVQTAITDITTAIDDFFERFTNWGGTKEGGVLGNLQGALGAPMAPGGARGAVVPGRDPGRRDNMLMPVRSGEAVMVPEWTQAIGGAPMVHAMNRAAENGTLGDILGSGMARGGVVGQSFNDLISNKVGALLESRVNELIGSASGGFASNGNWGPGVTGGFAANTAAAKAYIEAHFSGVSSIGGLYGGSVPGSDHPMGKALDVMIANYKSAQGIAAGNAIADWFQNNPNAFGTKYEIWRKQYREPGQPWGPYSHPSGSDDTLDHNDHVHLSFLTGQGQFSGQATSAPADDDPEKGGWLARILGRIKNGSPAVAAQAASNVAYDPNGGWEQWRGTVLQGLALIGQPASLADTVLNQIRTESSGNPRAINLYDSNAQRGTPSKGLIQTIDPTFQSYRLQGLANDPYDPLSNIVAGMRYAIDRYGSIQAGMRGVAYDNGGMLAPGTIGVNLLAKPEAVLTPGETSAYQMHARALADGFGGQVVINLDSSDPLQVAVGQMIRNGIDSERVEYARTLDRMAVQG